MENQLKILSILRVVRQRSAVVTLCMLCTLLFMVTNCGEQINNEHLINTGALCSSWTSFLDGISDTSEQSDVYVIKGIVSGVYKNGCAIELDEDLKGNFPKGVIEFNVWYNLNPIYEDDRLDCLSCYDEHDVLIMLLVPEKPSDFTTLQCVPSVFKISNGYVTGNRIISWSERLERWGLGNMTEDEFGSYIKNVPYEDLKSFTTIDTLTWDELKIKINNILKTSK